MQQKERKYIKCILNADSADFAVGPDEVINSENVRFGTTDAGVTDTIESIGSTTLLSEIQPSISLVEIGSAEDTANNRIIYCLADLYANNDKIICYYLETNIFYTVLLNSQVTGGLNFDKNSLIQCRVINGLFYWTDFLNQPRRININAGINLNQPGTISGVNPYVSPINAEVATIIRKPPVYPLTFTKITDATIDSNQIKNNAFRFTALYVYRDGEISTLAPHSLLSNYNYKAETFNAINVSFQFAEKIDQDVQKVQLIVIYVDGESAFVIKTWDKANSTDATAIANHNNGITPLTYEFANDSVGQAIDPISLTKLFDTVPLLSETLERAKNRLFLGRNLLGYNTPTQTSLTASIVSSSSTIVFGNYWVVSVSYNAPPAACLTYYWYFAYFSTAIDGTHPAGFYDLTATPLFVYSNACGSPSDPPTFPPSPLDISTYSFVTNDSSALFAYISLHDSTRLGVSLTGRHFNSVNSTFYFTSAQSGATPTNISVLKSDSPYRLGIVFYDQYLRQCGVLAGPKITTPDRTYADALSFDYGIRWNLLSGPRPDEIPDWAYYYSIPTTKSMRTSFFMQARAGSIVYATKDTSGNYVFTSTTYADSNSGIALKLDLLQGNGMGYSFQEGDIVKIYIQADATVHIASVIAQVGDWVVGELINLGSLIGKNALFEIYTPRVQTAAEFYYEIGSIYAITNPTTGMRSYSTLTDVLPGDVYILTQGTSPNTYLTENMSPNNTYWRNWFTSAGRQQFIDSIGQRFKQTSIKWSNTFIPGTITNGLSTFDALDEEILPGEMGSLRKLQVTSKVKDELGALMLGICEDETASMYLGETQQYGSAASTTLTVSTNVIGTINILKGSYGTIDPSSVVEFRGNVFWLDRLNGKFIQYSANGLFPISNYNMTRFWKLFSDQFNSMTQQQIENLGNRPFVFATVDPHHMELLISIPKLLNAPPKGMLPDYPFKDFPFDIYDGKGKTIVYKLNQEPNHWQGAYRFVAEGFITIQNKLFSFKYGQLYQHNSLISQCVFYGVQDRARIMCLSNMLPQVPKSYNNMTIQANMKPVFTYLYNDYPYQQSSDLIDADYRPLEGIFYSPIYRNKLIPTSTGYNINGLLTGEKMRAESLKIMLEFDVSQKQLEFKFIDVGFSISEGHTTLPK